MKLFFAIKRLDSAAGGAERVLCALCSELVTRGHDVAIVTFDLPTAQPFYLLDDRVRVINLGVGDSSQPAHIGVTFRRMLALRRVFKEERPQVAIGFMHSIFVPLSLSLSGLSIPVIGSEHIVPEHYRSRPLQFLSLIAASPLLTRVTVLSEAIRIRYPGILSKKMIAMPNPVISIDGQVDYDSKKTRYTLLNIGRLDEQKDHATLLQAFAKIATVLPSWNLIIIGEGPLRNKLEAMIDDYGLKDRVAMPGITSNIETEYCNADAFVISSRYESFGLVTAESMSYGLPVVGFADCPGTNALIESGKTGLLVAEGEDRAESLAVELQLLLLDQNLRKQLGQAGKQSIEGRFSIQHITDLWEKLLDSVCLKI